MNDPTEDAIWYCKIGPVSRGDLPSNSDAPMAKAVRDAFRKLTGHDDEFAFTGWGAKLTEAELAVVEGRLPRPRVIAAEARAQMLQAEAVIGTDLDPDGTTPTEPADELARLRAWKAEAMEVLGVWDQVHDALGSPAKLGQSKATASLAAAQRLVAPTEPAANGLEPGEIVAPRFYAMREQWSGEVMPRFYVVDSAGMGRIFLGRGVTAEVLAKQIGLRPITEEGQSC